MKIVDEPVHAVCNRPDADGNCETSLAAKVIDQPASYGKHDSVTDQKTGIDQAVLDVRYSKLFLDTNDNDREHLTVEKAQTRCNENHDQYEPVQVLFNHLDVFYLEVRA